MFGSRPVPLTFWARVRIYYLYSFWSVRSTFFYRTKILIFHIKWQTFILSRHIITGKLAGKTTSARNFIGKVTSTGKFTAKIVGARKLAEQVAGRQRKVHRENNCTGKLAGKVVDASAGVGCQANNGCLIEMVVVGKEMVSGDVQNKLNYLCIF